MLKCVSNSVVFNPIQFNILQTLSPIVSYHIYSHFSSTPISQTNVAIFWDLNNKPPKSVSLFDAAIGIKKAASAFGVVRYMAAFANANWLSSAAEGKVVNTLGNVTNVVKSEPSICGVCGKRFYNSDKLANHFKQVHETEQRKRLNQIEYARGSVRAKLVVKFSMKMSKYKNAVRDVLNSKAGNNLSDDLKRAGFWVKAMSNKREVAGDELRKHILNVIDMRQVECVVIVSDDSDFVNVIKEAKSRRLKTIVFGDSQDGDLKRTADAAFSWQEILIGKVKKQAVSVLGRWKDRDVLKSLEGSYNPETEKTR